MEISIFWIVVGFYIATGIGAIFGLIVGLDVEDEETRNEQHFYYYDALAKKEREENLKMITETIPEIINELDKKSNSEAV